jgi:NDP-sugar pyrophosphorylase family protein
MLAAADFFDLSATAHARLFDGTRYVWEAIDRIGAYLAECLATPAYAPNAAAYPLHPTSVLKGDAIHIHPTAKIDPGVFIEAPAVIGARAEVRQGAYLRGGVILGEGAIIGHASEVKNGVLLEGAAAPHFAYVGDSILGARVNLGAGTKLSNLAISSEKDPITHARPTLKLVIDGETYDTGLSKFGAILGDDVQLGCNSVTNPGAVIGPRTWVYPLVSLAKGYYPADSVIKLRQTLHTMKRRARQAGSL